MIDTIKLKSPYISEDIAKKFEDKALTRLCIDNTNDSILYLFTSLSLKGSFDNRISIQVKREEFFSYYDLRTLKTITSLRPCKPYLIIELSLHKFFLGHNVYGFDDNLKFQVSYFINFLEEIFIVNLPSYKYFEIIRLDYALVFDLGSLENVKNYIYSLNGCNYSRRKALKFSDTGIYFPGSTTTLKFYSKGEEFKKHDFKRLKKVLKYNELIELQEKANKILRVEIEVKSKKFKYDFGKNLKVGDFKMAYIIDLFDVELEKVLKETQSDLKVVRSSQDVKSRLQSFYSSNLANILIGFWYQLTIFGEKEVKNSVPKSTFYRQKKQLTDAGVTWLGTDLDIKKNFNVLDFVPNRKNCYSEIDLNYLKKAGGFCE